MPPLATPKLTVELVPSSCWYSNIRSQVPRTEWDRLRKLVYRNAGHKCEVCGGRGSRWPVEAHELWEYDDTTHTQRLLTIQALCPNCHAVKHLGRTSLCGDLEQAIEHLARVNEWSYVQAKQYAAECFKVWAERSEHEWVLDLTNLRNYDEPI